MGPIPKYSGLKHKIRQPGNANLRIGRGFCGLCLWEYIAGHKPVANPSDCHPGYFVFYLICLYYNSFTAGFAGK
ncbi:MAG: hypothetical protein BWY07_01497 [Candidatus Hydrogenedentes bacterium ADurb.Bin170]|jgi:hypothetical protein|nr:MAG: hypothetical protein BWY07_01497 [Candidatus Hydrogenedentes bacterium ADurb.Bin170]